MARRLARAGCVLAAALLLAVAPARAEALRLGYESWVAPGPFFIAQEKGWFAEEGVEVELVNIEDRRIRASALATGEVDAITADVDEAILRLASESEPRMVFAIAESSGGDGIIARSEIESMVDLYGRKVAVEPNSSRQFYLNVLLREAGMRETDIITVAKAPGAAGLAFERGEVDAAVTWQPWLARTALMADGVVLTDSTKQPGLLVEMVVTTAALAESRHKDFQALYRAWLRAVAWAEKNPNDSADLIAAGIGRWLRNDLVVKEMREGIAYYDAAKNEALFGTASAPGPLVGVINSAIDIWSGFGKLQTAAKPDELISWNVVTGN